MVLISIANVQYCFMLLLLWLFSSLILHFILKKSIHGHDHDHHHDRTINLPPSPPALPIIGHLYLLSMDFFKSFNQIATKYGPLLYLRFGASRPCVLISSGSMAAEIFKTDDSTLSGKPESPFGEDSILFGSGGFVTAQYGEYWRCMKKHSVMVLLGPTQVQRYCGIRRKERIGFLHKMFEKARKREIIQDMSKELMKLTGDVFCMMAMSTRIAEGAEAEKSRKMVMSSLDLATKMRAANALGPLFISIGLWMYGKQSREIITEFDTWLESIIKDHEERAKREGSERENKDLIDTLLEASQDETAQFKITKKNIKAFVLDLFIAGTNSTADTLQWAMAELINHPNVFEKVREEVESFVGKRLVEESDVPSLHYLQAVVKETLRLHEPLPVIPRECLKTCKFGKFDIPKETKILINVHAMMRDPNLWDNPDEFRPERFIDLDVNDQKENKGATLSYLPFGIGRRMCPGSTLALTTVNIVIATMIQCFDWNVVGKNGVGKDNGEVRVSMELEGGTTARMAHPIQCILKAPFNPFDV